MKKILESPFGVRLREAFGNAKNAEISRRLAISEPAVKNYIEGRIPSAETLIEISKLTNCSLHWLLTGNGSKEIQEGEGLQFEPDEKAALQRIALSSDETVESVIAMIVREWLFERGQIETVDEKEMLIPVYQMMDEMPENKRHEIIGRMMERTMKIANR